MPAFALLVAVGASAQGPAPPPGPGPAVEKAGAAQPDAKAPALEGNPLAPLAWLEGCWRASLAGREFDEHWLPLRSSVMVGASQTAAQGKSQTYEYLRLEARPDGVYYVIEPSGQSAEAFKLVEQTTDHAGGRNDEVFVFADPARTFPQKITYRRASQGWLYALIEGKVNGQDRQMTYPLRRVGCESGEFLGK